MKRILIFHPIIAPYRIDFFNFIANNGVTEVCLKWTNLKDQTFDYEKIEKKFNFAPTYLGNNYFTACKVIFDKLRNFNPNVVFVSECGFISAIVVLYSKLFHKKYKIISMIDDSYDMLVGKNQFTKKHALAEKILIPHFDEIITVEPRVTHHFQQKYGKGCYFPIIVDEVSARIRYKEVLPLSEKYVKEYSLDGKKILLFVGRLVELKNLQQIIPIVKKQEDPNLRFVIVGDGDYKHDLQKLAQGDSRILFVGRFEGDALYAWYNIANYLILPSLREAFGAVINEALLAGCKVLVSNRAGSSCLVKEDVNGHLFSPVDGRGIEQCLKNSIYQAEQLHLPLSLRKNLMTIDFTTAFHKVQKLIQS